MTNYWTSGRKTSQCCKDVI